MNKMQRLKSLSLRSRLVIVSLALALALLAILVSLVPSLVARVAPNYRLSEFNRVRFAAPGGSLDATGQALVGAGGLGRQPGLVSFGGRWWFANKPVKPLFYWPVCHDLQEYERGRGHLSLAAFGAPVTFINDRYDHANRAILIAKNGYLIAPPFIYFSQSFSVYIFNKIQYSASTLNLTFFIYTISFLQYAPFDYAYFKSVNRFRIFFYFGM
jgi:hypothetical protein